MITNQLLDLSVLYLAPWRNRHSLWASGQEKAKTNIPLLSPILAISHILTHFFLFLVSIHFFVSSHFPVLYYVQSAFTPRASYLNAQQVCLRWLISNCQKGQKDNKKKKEPPSFLSFSLSLCFFFSPQTYWLWCLHGFHKQCHLKGASETRTGKLIAMHRQRFWSVSLSFGKRANTTPTQIKKVQVGSNVPQRRGASSSTVQRHTHTHMQQEHRNHRCAVCGLSTYAFVAWLNKLQYRWHRCVFVWMAMQRFLNYSWFGKQHLVIFFFFLDVHRFYIDVLVVRLFFSLFSHWFNWGIYIKHRTYELHPGKTLHVVNYWHFLLSTELTCFSFSFASTRSTVIAFENWVIPKSVKSPSLNWSHFTPTLVMK